MYVIIIFYGAVIDIKKDLAIIQVVGYKHSGKTTLMKKLIRTAINDLSLKVATLKHHGHGGEPDIVQGTDSYKHLQAGAQISGIQGEDRLQLKITGLADADLDKIIRIYQSFPIDFLLIEGYKHAPYPKIVLINDHEDEQLLLLENIIAVGGWSAPTITEKRYPIFSINQFAKFKHLFIQLFGHIKRRTINE